MAALQTLSTVAMGSQRRERDGIVYDLSCSGCPLWIRICCRDGEAAATPEERWRVDARESHEPDAVIVVACGPTRADALEAVGRWWRSQEEALHLWRFDWGAIYRLLASVSAV